MKRQSAPLATTAATTKRVRSTRLAEWESLRRVLDDSSSDTGSINAALAAAYAAEPSLAFSSPDCFQMAIRALMLGAHPRHLCRFVNHNILQEFLLYETLPPARVIHRIMWVMNTVPCNTFARLFYKAIALQDADALEGFVLFVPSPAALHAIDCHSIAIAYELLSESGMTSLMIQTTFTTAWARFVLDRAFAFDDFAPLRELVRIKDLIDFEPACALILAHGRDERALYSSPRIRAMFGAWFLNTHLRRRSWPFAALMWRRVRFRVALRGAAQRLVLRAAERVYAPGNVGFHEAHRSFDDSRGVGC